MKKTLSIFLTLALISASCYIFFEPQVINAVYDENLVSQEVTGEISIDCGNTVSMLPAIPGQTGGNGYGTTTCTITTSNTDGYTLTLRASSSPALAIRPSLTDNFANYTPSSAGVPDFTWSVAAGAAEFGYTVEGSITNVATLFEDNGAACNTAGQQNSFTCWLDASSTAAATIGVTSGPIVSGTTTYIGYRAQANSPSPAKTEGTYTATTSFTATMN